MINEKYYWDLQMTWIKNHRLYQFSEVEKTFN